MSKRTRIDTKNKDLEKRFASWFKMMIDLVSPKNLMVVAGRGTAKTSDIIAERSMDIILDMPGAYLVFVADTYVNALKNVVPTLLEGWNRKGWVKGIHYVTDEAPPAHFKKPYKPVQNYKHTISIYNGAFFNIVSMDQPSGAAGNSYQHMFGDEAKYLDFQKLKKLTPALRGEYVSFGHSVFYRGSTFTTDMPNIMEGEHDWILDRKKNMNTQQIKDALKVGFVINEINKELYNAIRDKDTKKIKSLQKQKARWLIRWHRVRKDSTLFYTVSSFVNADVLTPGYFSDSLKALGIEEFKTSVMSLTPNLKQGEKFYPNLGEHHFLTDAINGSYYDKYKIGDDVEESSLALKYIAHNQPLDCGIDFGDMLSMVIGQEIGNFVYMHKNLHTLPPESSEELAKQFLDFFKYHKHKVLNMYYDRSGNQFSRIKRDWASEIKTHIEKYKGSNTGWTVNLMNRNQATIYHEEEYNFMRIMFGEYNDKLPKIKICKFGCRELKSSLELSKIKIRTDTKKGSKTVHKVKTSEKLPLKKLPMFSTNYSDAAKYFFYRPKWVQETKHDVNSKLTEPGVY